MQAPRDVIIVSNFDPRCTRYDDLEQYFEDYGPLRRLHICRNHASALAKCI